MSKRKNTIESEEELFEEDDASGVESEIDDEEIKKIEDSDEEDESDGEEIEEEVDDNEEIDEMNEIEDEELKTTTELLAIHGLNESNDFDDSNFYSKVNTNMELTTEYLTRFERVNAICTRATMLSRGAQSTLDPETYKLNVMTPLEIAEEELKTLKMPFIIKRRLPNGKEINININKLINTGI